MLTNFSFLNVIDAAVIKFYSSLILTALDPGRYEFSHVFFEPKHSQFVFRIFTYQANKYRNIFWFNAEAIFLQESRTAMQVL